MYLYVPSRGFIDHVTEEDILKYVPGEEVAHLCVTEGIYMQCADCGPAGYALEYRIGGYYGEQFKALEESITLERVLSAFVKYLRDDGTWLTDFRWSKLDDESGLRPDAASAPPSDNPYQSPATVTRLPPSCLSWDSYRAFWQAAGSWGGLSAGEQLFVGAGPLAAMATLVLTVIFVGIDWLDARTSPLLPGLLTPMMACPVALWVAISMYFVWRWRVVLPLRHLDALVASNPLQAQYYFQRGELLLFQTPETGWAISDFTVAINLRPDHWQAHGRRAEAYLRVQEYDRAVADATQAIALVALAGDQTSERWWVYRVRGRAQQAQEQWRAAIDDFTAAIGHLGQVQDVSPDNLAGLYYARATNLRRMGDRAAARRDFAAAHRHDWCWSQEPRRLLSHLPVLLAVCALGLLVSVAVMLIPSVLHFLYGTPRSP